MLLSQRRPTVPLGFTGEGLTEARGSASNFIVGCLAPSILVETSSPPAGALWPRKCPKLVHITKSTAHPSSLLSPFTACCLEHDWSASHVTNCLFASQVTRPPHTWTCSKICVLHQSTAEALCRGKSSKTQHRVVPLLNPAVILLHPMVQVTILSVYDRLTQHLCDRPRISIMAIRGHPLRSTADDRCGTLEERLRRFHVSSLAEQRIKQVPSRSLRGKDSTTSF